MKKIMLLLFVIAPIAAVPINAIGGATSQQVGEALYNKHCSACHPEAGKLKLTKNIIEIMRNPMSTMPEFDKRKISDADAIKIDDYIHQEFDRVAKQSRNI
jgi:mono/diheme cytochrome c family protein